MTPADSAQLRARLQALFGADLTIDRELGRGGMAAVFAAFDPGLHRQVAVKMLLPALAEEPEVADRFVREGRTMASLNHPNVVAVYAVRSGGGTYAIVMQFVDGFGLDALLADQPMLPLRDAGWLLSQVAAGLQHAHDRGVVHRDVKPGNVLVDAAGRALISDFGIARRQDGGAATKTGMILGTTDYMSPEQRSGEKVTAAADQYALGVMAFELLAGRKPFVGTLAEIIRGHMVMPPPSLSALRPEVPAEVDAAIQRLLAKDPAERWPSLGDFERVVATLGQTVATVPTTPAPHATAARPSSIGMRLVGTIGITAGLATAAWMWNGRGQAPTRPIAVAARTSDTTQSVPVADPALPPSTRREAVPGAPVRGSAQRDLVPVAPTSRAPSSMPSRAPESALRTETAAPRATPLATPPAAAERIAPPPTAAPTAAPTAVPAAANAAANAPAPAPAPAATVSPTGAPTVTAVLADARQIGRAFVTMLNQRRARELAQLDAVGGNSVTRAELMALVGTANDFAAGFERLPSAPSAWTSGFETECYLDLEWRGGHRLMRVTLYATRASGEWRLAGLAVFPVSE